MADNELLLGKAYGIFHSEFHKHLQNADGMVSKKSLEKEELKRLSAYFHTIRGGAGFFGLTTIAEVSKSLEYLFLEPTFQIDRELQKVVDMLTKLKLEGEKLPEPKK